MLISVDRLKRGKAPGPDGIEAEAIKSLVCEKRVYCLNMFNRLYADGNFQEPWKVGKVILIPKPGRDLGLPSAYRPICLLNTLGKLYETTLRRQLVKALDATKGLSEHQYGFRKGRSTLGAIEEILSYAKNANRNNKWAAIIFLDVRNAFNTAS